MEWENIFANDAADKRLVSKIYKEHSNLLNVQAIFNLEKKVIDYKLVQYSNLFRRLRK